VGSIFCYHPEEIYRNAVHAFTLFGCVFITPKKTVDGEMPPKGSLL